MVAAVGCAEEGKDMESKRADNIGCLRVLQKNSKQPASSRRTCENRGWAMGIVIFGGWFTNHKQRLPTGKRVC